jgi:hypothetical protein
MQDLSSASHNGLCMQHIDIDHATVSYLLLEGVDK